MKQYEAVIQVMEENGGCATLGHLYEHALKVAGCTWKTKTPFASIRRIVQDDRFFFKIEPGLWALRSHRDELASQMFSSRKAGARDEKFTHSYYQGLLVELGNLSQFETFVPAQDKGKPFLAKGTLRDLATVKTMPSFTYGHVVAKARTVDVVWLNMRRFPHSLFEVEHTTDMKNSLIKFVELQDFRTKMVIVAPGRSRGHFDRTLALAAFQPIRRLVDFWDYEQVSSLHSRTYELMAARRVPCEFLKNATYR